MYIQGFRNKSSILILKKQIMKYCEILRKREHERVKLTNLEEDITANIARFQILLWETFLFPKGCLSMSRECLTETM